MAAKRKPNTTEIEDAFFDMSCVDQTYLLATLTTLHRLKARQTKATALEPGPNGEDARIQPKDDGAPF